MTHDAVLGALGEPTDAIGIEGLALEPLVGLGKVGLGLLERGVLCEEERPGAGARVRVRARARGCQPSSDRPQPAVRWGDAPADGTEP